MLDKNPEKINKIFLAYNELIISLKVNYVHFTESFIQIRLTAKFLIITRLCHHKTYHLIHDEK